MRDKKVMEYLEDLVVSQMENGFLTCREIAGRTGVSYRTVRGLAEGTVRPSFSTLAKIGAGLELDLTEEARLRERSSSVFYVERFRAVWEELNVKQKRTFRVWASLGFDGQEALQKLQMWMKGQAIALKREEMIGLGELPDPEARFPGISARAGFSLWKSLSREKRKSLLELENFDFAQRRIFHYWRRVGRSEELKLLALLER